MIQGADMEYGTTRTEFASPERSDPETLERQLHLLLSESFLVKMMDCFPEPVLVLNKNRQIVLANDKMADLLGRSRSALMGLRPGEAVGCIYGSTAESGCGTTKFCKVCGAVRAILNCQTTGASDIQECNISCTGDNGPFSLDLKVWTNPLRIGDEEVTVFAIRDISSDNRRKVMERLFFHDALNAAGGIHGVISAMPDLSPEELPEMEEMARDCSEQLVELLESQRDLAAAEMGELKAQWKDVEAGPFLEHVAALYQRHPVGKDKRVITEISDPRILQTDPVILGRVIGNLMKNALEASVPGQTVTASFRFQEQPVICIHNESVIPEEIQLQLFQRSVSTKGTQHRGIGTYSIKLLTEKYLKGRVSFRSLPGEGTTFEIRLPKDRPE
jgi:nitrogen-specific signal transduction histidine kinase